MLITDTAKLTALCDDLAGVPYLAVDTEFLREKTYWPKLCLIQVAHGDISAAIDPLAEGINLDPLLDLMDDPAIVKVFHSASQDLEVFYRLRQSLPLPLFDTQIAASVCGHGEQPGYGNLVSRMLGVEIDKSSQFTDWSRRPLSKKQINYALSDVVYLCPVYDLLVEQLTKSGRLEWAKEEMKPLIDEGSYRIDPRQSFRRIKLRKPTRKTLGVLRELAEWRENTAMARDLPRNWVIRDESLVEIATHLPDSAEDLEAVRGMAKRAAHGREGRELLEAVDRGLEVPKDELPEPATPRKSPKRGGEGLAALLKALLKLRCDEEGIAQHMVASADELERLAAGDTKDLRPLQGWRKDIFGTEAQDLLAGRVALVVKGTGVRVIPIEELDPE